MKEKTLFKIAILGIIIGLPLLYYYSQNINLDQISRITLEETGKEVKVSGKVIDSTNLDKFTIIKISRPEIIEVIVFDNISVSIGQEVDVFGKIDEFNNQPQIVADIVRKKKG